MEGCKVKWLVESNRDIRKGLQSERGCKNNPPRKLPPPPSKKTVPPPLLPYHQGAVHGVKVVQRDAVIRQQGEALVLLVLQGFLEKVNRCADDAELAPRRGDWLVNLVSGSSAPLVHRDSYIRSTSRGFMITRACRACTHTW